MPWTDAVFLAASLPVALSRVSLLAQRGYVRHVGGVLHAREAARVLRKLTAQYPALADHPQQAARRRARGEAAARLTAWVARDHRIAWTIQVTADGGGPVVEQERLRDARRVREALRIGDYELVRMPRKEQQPAWTWRVRRDRWAAIAATGLAMARQRDLEAAQRFIALELKRPGFRGTILQRRALFRAMARARRRQHLTPPLEAPRRMPFLGRIEHRRLDVHSTIRSLVALGVSGHRVAGRPCAPRAERRGSPTIAPSSGGGHR